MVAGAVTPGGSFFQAITLPGSLPKYWTQFATFATPNYQGAVAWPAYSLTNEPQLVLASTLTTATNLDDACALWSSFEP